MLIVAVLMSRMMTDQLTNSPRCLVEEERVDAPKRGEFLVEDFEGIEIEPFQVTNKRDQRLRGEILFCPEPTDRVCIVCHGWTSNRIGAYKYVKAILDQKFHVVVYDHTNCGNSQGKYGSMGGYESDDLSDVIDFAKEKFGKDSKLLTYGESMGAVTVLMNMGKDTRVDAVVADCPFADLYEENVHILKHKKMVPTYPVICFADMIFKHRTGFTFRQVSPYQVIKEANGLPEVPLLLIHGAADKFILPSQSEKIKAVKKGHVELHFIEDAGHAVSIMKAPKEYKEILKKYINDIFART